MQPASRARRGGERQPLASTRLVRRARPGILQPLSGVRAGRAPRRPAAIVLAGPTVLAFFTGGYFAEPRAWAGCVAWAAGRRGGARRSPRPLPRGRGSAAGARRPGRLAAWSLLSIAWAPIAGDAYHAGQIVLLYLGPAGRGRRCCCGDRRARRAVEPALAAGALIVIGYGLSGRLLPGLLHFARSVSAQGRLEQPLTYWNAMGELAALGLVLAARLAGDARAGRAAADRGGRRRGAARARAVHHRSRAGRCSPARPAWSR